MRIFTLAAFIIFTALCIIVAVSNRNIISFSLHPLPFQWDMPVYLLLFAGIFIGLGAGAMVMMAKSIKQSHHNRQQTKKIQTLENKISDLGKSVKELTPPENS